MGWAKCSPLMDVHRRTWTCGLSTGGDWWGGNCARVGRCREFDEIWPSIASDQEGIVARRQLTGAGLTWGAARREIVARRWQRLYAGVFATFTGPVPDHAQIWAAVLRSGSGAVAGHRTALWLWGVLDERPDLIDIVIPHDRRVEPVIGLHLWRMRGLTQLSHPVASPPRLRVEAAVLAATERASAGTVVDLTLRAVQRRLTTAPRLLAGLGTWPRHRCRRLLSDILGEAGDGTASALELRYFRDVERAHGLPRGRRNAPDSLGSGTVRRYRDLSCEATRQVIQVLRRQGWTGTPTKCGPHCRL
jgi:hypothetical protein